MTNTLTSAFSGSTIRAIVSGVFGIDPRKIILSIGELTPFESWQNESHDGSLGESSTTYKVWGWSAEAGFVPAPDGFVGDRSGSNYAHSSSCDVPGKELHEWPGVDQFSFILTYVEEYSNWAGSQHRDYKGYTLWKAPDFSAHRSELELADITRWEQWYNA